MKLETFLPHVGESFEVNVGAPQPMPIVLIEATALHASAPQLRRDPFQLKFSGPGPDHLNQMIHHLSHATLGQMEIFLVPIGRHEDGYLYQAIFN